jgi:hypothetical protein
MRRPALPSSDPDGGEERVAFPRARIRAEPRRDTLHAGLAAALLAMTGGMFFVGGFVGAIGWLLAVVAPAFGLLAWQRAHTPSGGAKIEASPAGLFSAGKRLVAREDIKRAVVIANEGGAGALVSIQRRRGFFVAVEVPSEEEGQRLVSALGVSAEQRTAEFLVDSPLAARLPVAALLASLVALVAVSFVGLANGHFEAFAPLLGWYALFLAWARPTVVTIGTDGVLLSYFGKETLVPFSEMVGCARDSGGLCFQLSSGRSVRVRAAWTALQKSSRTQPELRSADAYLDALEARIRQARQAAGGADVAALDRKERPIAAWLAHLRALTLREAKGFRDAPVVPEALWKTVENGHAEPAVRAAAAVALGPSLDDDGRARLRVAAGTVAAPRLRVALSAAADGDEEALSSALAELEMAREGSRRAAG